MAKKLLQLCSLYWMILFSKQPNKTTTKSFICICRNIIEFRMRWSWWSWCLIIVVFVRRTFIVFNKMITRLSASFQNDNHIMAIKCCSSTHPIRCTIGLSIIKPKKATVYVPLKYSKCCLYCVLFSFFFLSHFSWSN